MRLSSVAAVALLSGVSLGAPGKKKEACDASTVTVTVTNSAPLVAAPTITVTSPGPSVPISGSSASISVGGGFNPPASGNGSGSNSGSGGSDGNSSNGIKGLNVDVPGNAPTPAGPGGAMVTQYDQGEDGKQTVRACPTGQQNYDCFEAVYGSDGKMIIVHVVSIAITTVNGQTTTSTVTKNDAPHITPGPAPKNDAGSPDAVFTQVVDVTETTTKNGKTITKTHTHHSTIIGTGTGSASNAKPTHQVSVGKHGKLEFDPPKVQASAGDTVRFTFYPRNHSVTSCSFDDPCIENGQFDSGFKFTFIKNSTTFIDYPVADDNKPVHFFSKQKGECKQGMVFAINPDKFEKFLSNARNFDEKKLKDGTINGTLNHHEHTWNGTDHYRNDTGNRHEHEHSFNGTDHKNETEKETSPGSVKYGGRKRSFPVQLSERR